MNLGVILVAGGTGSRMQSAIPKQYLPLAQKPIAQHSLELFLQIPKVKELVIVCAEEYRTLFPDHTLFADPGERRQDSVWNGLQRLSRSIDFVCIHDAARPLITLPLIEQLLKEAEETGAATLAMPLKFTVKRSDANAFVEETPPRSTLWEIQTPQCLKKAWLEEGFTHANQHNLTATDDVGLIEPLGYPVKLVQGCYSNLKITTPEDLVLAEHLWNNRNTPTSFS